MRRRHYCCDSKLLISEAVDQVFFVLQAGLLADALLIDGEVIKVLWKCQLDLDLGSISRKQRLDVDFAFDFNLVDFVVALFVVGAAAIQVLHELYLAVLHEILKGYEVIGRR